MAKALKIVAIIVASLLFSSRAVAATIDFEGYAVGTFFDRIVFDNTPTSVHLIEIRGTVQEKDGNRFLELEYDPSRGYSFGWLVAGAARNGIDDIIPIVRLHGMDILFSEESGYGSSYVKGPLEAPFNIPLNAWTQWSPEYSLIRGQGQIRFYGRGSIDNINFDFATTTVPEPGMWLTMLVGFGAIGHAARSRKGHWRARA